MACGTRPLSARATVDLPDPGRPEQQDDLAGCHVETHAVRRILGAIVISDAHISQPQGGFGSRHSANHDVVTGAPVVGWAALRSISRCSPRATPVLSMRLAMIRPSQVKRIGLMTKRPK
jgi:hypothetical protein